MNNPLWQDSSAQSDDADLPDFAAIRPEHVAPAMEALLAQADAALEKAVGAEVAADYDAMSAVLDVAGEKLKFAWGAVGHLNAVADTAELRAAYVAALPKITELSTRHASDERLYAKYKAIVAANELAAPGKALSAPRRKALSNAMRDFVLSGAELQGAAKARFLELQEAQADLGQKFSEHLLDATDGFAYYATEAELIGVPTDAVQASRQAAAAEGKDGHKLTLHFPSYFPVLQYGENRELREKIYTAYATRASEAGPVELDNSGVMRELMALRHEEARLLGYANFAEVSLVSKMADTPKQVMDFLRDLARRARPYAERDLAELKTFARDELGLPELESWDMTFASEKLKEARYAFSDQEVKQYFTETKVLDGLFRIIETLFEVNLRPDSSPVWHPSVRFFRIERAGTLIGQFYLDPYARSGKRPGAWMDDARSAPGVQLHAAAHRGRPIATCTAVARRGDHPLS